MFATKHPKECSVKSCVRNLAHSCFPLPKDNKRAKIWMLKCGIKKKCANTMICEAHFSPELISHECNPKHLARQAVPTLNLQPKEVLRPQDSTQDISKITPGVRTQSTVRNVSGSNQAIYSINFLDKVITKSLTEPTSEPKKSETLASQGTINAPLIYKIINGPNYAEETISELKTKLNILSRWPDVALKLPLKIYLKCPQGYEILHRTLQLPPVSNLRRVFDGCVITTDNKTFTSVLQYKSEIMSVKQKQCILCLGTIDVNKNLYYDIKRDKLIGVSEINNIQKPVIAYKIMVLFLQGIFSNWKQPIDIAYLSSPKDDNLVCIDQWIEKNIGILLKIGFGVRAVVCDTDDLLMTTSPHHDTYRKMYYIHDIGSLLKLFFLTFLKHDFIFGYKIAKMQDILDYFELDIKNQPRLSPELTEKKLKPTSILDVNTKDVMEIISLKTVAAMTTYINLQALKGTAKNTVELIAKMSKFLEVIYSNKCDFVSRETCKQVLLDMLPFFDNFKVINRVTKKVLPVEYTFVPKFKSTIKAILMLNADMKCYDNIKAFPIKHLSLDNVRSFFEQIKLLKKNSTKPTCKKVYLAYLQSALINVLKPCYDQKLETDLESNLYKIKHILAKQDRSLESFILPSDMAIKSSEYNTLDFENKDAIILLAGFLLKKCHDRHSDCDDMRNYTFIVLQDTSVICKTILREIQENVCVVPQESFIEFVEMMEILFRSFMTKQTLESKDGLIKGLLERVQPVIFPMPCSCFPLNYAKKLFLRVRLYNTLKYNNICLSEFPEQYKNVVINDL